MACDPNQVITTSDMENLKENITYHKTVVESNLDTAPTPDGQVRDTLTGRLKKLGYVPPVVYAAGITFTLPDDKVKTIERNGVIYAPLPSQIPFTTSGTWTGDDENKFFVVQGITTSSLPTLTDLVFDNLNDALNSGLLIEGALIRLKEHTLGKGGGGDWDVVLTSSVTPNNVDVVQSVSNPTLSLSLRKEANTVILDKVGVFADETGSDANAIAQVLINKGNSVIYPKGLIYFSTPLVIPEGFKGDIAGLGEEISRLVDNSLDGVVFFDASASYNKTAVKVHRLSLLGQNKTNSKGLVLFNWTNQCLVEQIKIDGTSIGLEVAGRSFYATYRDIQINGSLNIGVNLMAPSGNDQINALEFNNLRINNNYVGDHCMVVDGGNGSRTVTFTGGSTFEKSGKTCVIVRNVAPVSFSNCYFEDNYYDASVAGSSEVLTWDNPIHIKLDSGANNDQHRFEACYFKYREDYAASSEKCGFYIVDTIAMSIMNSRFGSNLAGHVDVDIYNNGAAPIYANQITRDGASTKFYVGPYTERKAYMKYSVAWAGTSGLGTANPIDHKPGSRLYVKLIPSATASGSSNNLRITGKYTGTTYFNKALPASYTAGVIVDESVGFISTDEPLNAFLTTSFGTTLNMDLVFYNRVVGEYGLDLT